MKTLLNSLVLILLLLASHTIYGQMGDYAYKRELRNISGTWHSVPLLNGIFSKITNHKYDVRIFGIKTNGDTVQAPYIWRVFNEKRAVKELAFRQLNTSKQGNVHYFTFEIKDDVAVNRIALAFENENFDWKLTLEGSQTQRDWFTVLEDYRILSLKNDFTDYRFTKIAFPYAKYRYFRIGIKSTEKPILTSASVFKYEIDNSIYRAHKVQNLDIQQLKDSRQTAVHISLAMPVPVDEVVVDVRSNFDYYRRVAIQYVYDSLKTPQGMKAQFRTFGTGTLTSLDENAFPCEGQTVQHLRLLIENQDNEPLNIGNVVVKGYGQELIARFTEPASYYLVYGNEKADAPQYDISRFAKDLPDTLKMLSLSEEMAIDKEMPAKDKPLFENPLWLWAIIGTVIALLGWFSLKMLEGRDRNDEL